MEAKYAVGVGLAGAAAAVGATQLLAPESAHAETPGQQDAAPERNEQATEQARGVEVISPGQLEALASRYNISVEELLTYNGIDPSDQSNLVAGTRLTIPQSATPRAAGSSPSVVHSGQALALSTLPEVSTPNEPVSTDESVWEWVTRSAGEAADGIGEVIGGVVDRVRESELPSRRGGLGSYDVVINGVSMSLPDGASVEVDPATGSITINPGASASGAPSNEQSVETVSVSSARSGSGDIRWAEGSSTSLQGLESAIRPEINNGQISFASVIQVKGDTINAEALMQMIELVGQRPVDSSKFPNPEGYYLMPDSDTWSDLDYTIDSGTVTAEQFADKKTLVVALLVAYTQAQVAQEAGIEYVPELWDFTSTHKSEHFNGGDIDIPFIEVNGQYDRELNLRVWERLILLQWPDGSPIFRHVQFYDTALNSQLNELVRSKYGTEGDIRPKFNDDPIHNDHFHVSLDDGSNSQDDPEGNYMLPIAKPNENSTVNYATEMTYAEAAQRVANSAGSEVDNVISTPLPSGIASSEVPSADELMQPLEAGVEVQIHSPNSRVATSENAYQLVANWEAIFDQNNPELSDEERANIKEAIRIGVANGDRINPLLLVGQFGGESGFGTSSLARKSNNGFGMTGNPDSNSYDVVWHNDNGNLRPFIKFDTIGDGIQYYVDRITSLPQYQDQLNCHSSIDEAIDALWHELAPDSCRIIARQGEGGVLSYGEVSDEEYKRLVHSVVDGLHLEELFIDEAGTI